jgi:hypothetical protein
MIKTKSKISLYFNRSLYVFFVVMAFYLFLIEKNKTFGGASLGLALAFDPFTQTVHWQKRPIWQRVLLLVHVAVVTAIFCTIILKIT